MGLLLYILKHRAIKVLVVLILSMNVFSCNSEDISRTEKIKSSEFSSLSEKILHMEKYVNFRRRYIDLDFNINYQDNSIGAIPAPSDWDIRIIAVVPKNEISRWLSGMKLSTENIDKTWLQDIPSNINYQYISEWYELYGQKFVGVDRSKGIVVYRNVTY